MKTRYQAHIPPLSWSPCASNTSCAINSLALKYLSYEELGRELQPSIAGRARNLGARRPDQRNTACPVMDWVVDQDRVLLAKMGRIKQVVSHQAQAPARRSLVWISTITRTRG